MPTGFKMNLMAARENKRLEFVKEKWSQIFPKRQTKTKNFGVCLVQSEPNTL